MTDARRGEDGEEEKDKECGSLKSRGGGGKKATAPLRRALELLQKPVIRLIKDTPQGANHPLM